MNIFPVNTGSFQDQGFTSPAAVPEGVLAAFTQDGNLLQLDDGGDADTTQDTLTAQPTRLVLGGEYPRLSRVLTPENVVEVKKQVYVAPVKQQSTITFTAPDEAGEAGIDLVDYSETGKHPYPRKYYSIRLDGTETAAEVATAFANEINAHDSAFVTATTSTADLILESVELHTLFDVALQGQVEGDAVALTREYNRGSGTGRQVAAIEEANEQTISGERYVDNGLLGRRADMKAYADETLNYDLYHIRYRNPATHQGLNSKFEISEVIVAVATTGVTGTLDGFFETA